VDFHQNLSIPGAVRFHAGSARENDLSLPFGPLWDFELARISHSNRAAMQGQPGVSRGLGFRRVL
jgi:hypothetical protein